MVNKDKYIRVGQGTLLCINVTSYRSGTVDDVLLLAKWFPTALREELSVDLFERLLVDNAAWTFLQHAT